MDPIDPAWLDRAWDRSSFGFPRVERTERESSDQPQRQREQRSAPEEHRDSEADEFEEDLYEQSQAPTQPNAIPDTEDDETWEQSELDPEESVIVELGSGEPQADDDRLVDGRQRDDGGGGDDDDDDDGSHIDISV